MVVEVRQRLGEDLYVLFEDGKFKYDISLFDDLAGKYVYATGSEKDSLDYYVSEGDYSYLEEGGNNYIEFVAGFPVENFFSFKVLDVKPEFDRTTTIVEMADINPTNLNLEFNNIRDYMFLIQDIISKKTLRYDADYDSSMLPKLANGEFWLKTETGFRASNFETLEALIKDAFKDFFGIIGGENSSYVFNGVTALDGDWIETDTLGINIVEGIAVQKGDAFGTYYVMTSGFVLIPEGETDDTGALFVTNGDYYQSLTVTGKFSPLKPVSGIAKLVFKVIEDTVGVQYALIKNYPHTIGDGTVSSEYVKYFNTILDMQGDLTLGLNQRIDIDAVAYKIVNTIQPIQLDNGLYAEAICQQYVKYYSLTSNMIADLTLCLEQLVKIGSFTYKISTDITGIPLDNGLYAGSLGSFSFNTVAEMVTATYLVEGDRIQLWGYYNLFDKSEHKRAISSIDNGTGIAIAGGLFANYTTANNTISARQFGLKLDGTDAKIKIQKFLDLDYNNIMFDNGTINIDDKIYLNGLNKVFDFGEVHIYSDLDCLGFCDKKPMDFSKILNGYLRPQRHGINFDGIHAITFSTIDGMDIRGQGANGSPIYLKNNIAEVQSCNFYNLYLRHNDITNISHIIEIEAGGSLFNENNFKNIWLHSSYESHAIRMSVNALASSGLYNNTFEKMNFEVCSGGAFLLSYQIRINIKEISLWDAPVPYKNDIITFENPHGHSFQCQSTNIDGYNRTTILGAGIYDIREIGGLNYGGHIKNIYGSDEVRVLSREMICDKDYDSKVSILYRDVFLERGTTSRNNIDFMYRTYNKSFGTLTFNRLLNVTTGTAVLVSNIINLSGLLVKDIENFRFSYFGNPSSPVGVAHSNGFGLRNIIRDTFGYIETFDLYSYGYSEFGVSGQTFKIKLDVSYE